MKKFIMIIIIILSSCGNNYDKQIEENHNRIEYLYLKYDNQIIHRIETYYVTTFVNIEDIIYLDGSQKLGIGLKGSKIYILPYEITIEQAKEIIENIIIEKLGG